ncbi:MAG: hypothetical protein ACJA0U_001202 [Salibacteraceae bacterium]|jgi:hypothetical protein
MNNNQMKNGIKLKALVALTVIYLFTVLSSLTYKNEGPPGNANVTIPAKQEFVLGEFQKSGYRARLINKSDLDFEVLVVDKKTNERTQGFGVEGKGSTAVNIRKNEKVLLRNTNNQDIVVKVKLMIEVQGMRYQELGAYDKSEK